MTSVFSWLLTKTGSQVRFILAGEVSVRMDRGWEAEQWTVRHASLRQSSEDAREVALAETGDLEDIGFTLFGPVSVTTADIVPVHLYMECQTRDPIGPILEGLFMLAWSDL